jgi:hypothetical protein
MKKTLLPILWLLIGASTVMLFNMNYHIVSDKQLNPLKIENRPPQDLKYDSRAMLDEYMNIFHVTDSMNTVIDSLGVQNLTWQLKYQVLSMEKSLDSMRGGTDLIQMMNQVQEISTNFKSYTATITELRQNQTEHLLKEIALEVSKKKIWSDRRLYVNSWSLEEQQQKLATMKMFSQLVVDSFIQDDTLIADLSHVLQHNVRAITLQMADTFNVSRLTLHPDSLVIVFLKPGENFDPRSDYYRPDHPDSDSLWVGKYSPYAQMIAIRTEFFGDMFEMMETVYHELGHDYLKGRNMTPDEEHKMIEKLVERRIDNIWIKYFFYHNL